MAWEGLKTYTVGELLTASDMNLYQRNNLEAVLPYGVTWQTYTPTLTAATTNPSLGTGATQDGRYYRIGRQAVVAVRLVFGSSPSAGSGVYSVSLPISWATSAASFGGGGGYLLDSSTAARRSCTVRRASATTVNVIFDGGTVSDANPWTWAASDEINFTVPYEAA